MNELQTLYGAILDGDKAMASDSTLAALKAGVRPAHLVDQCMIPAMNEVGRRFETNEYFVPELLLAARAMKTAMVHIRPLLAAAGTASASRVVIGTVKGDLHDIGKNLVAALLEGGGFEVIDLGIDVDPNRFIEAVREVKPDIVCLSALLTVTMPAMQMTIEMLKAAGVRDQIKIMVGGAPVTAKYAREIGADGYSENASTAVTLARRLTRVAAIASC